MSINNTWNDYKSLEFQKYNETERLILYFRIHLGILNRKEISKKTGVSERQIRKFVKAIKTYETYPKEDSHYRVGESD